MQSLLGEQRAVELCEVFPAHLYYGNMGARDVSLVFREESVGDATAVGVKQRETDSVTGRMQLTREGEFSTVQQFLPDVFEVH